MKLVSSQRLSCLTTRSMRWNRCWPKPKKPRKRIKTVTQHLLHLKLHLRGTDNTKMSLRMTNQIKPPKGGCQSPNKYHKTTFRSLRENRHTPRSPSQSESNHLTTAKIRELTRTNLISIYHSNPIIESFSILMSNNNNNSWQFQGIISKLKQRFLRITLIWIWIWILSRRKLTRAVSWALMLLKGHQFGDRCPKLRRLLWLMMSCMI
jgi:hypothetical protein